MDVNIYGVEVMTAAYGIEGNNGYTRTTAVRVLERWCSLLLLFVIYAIYVYSTLWGQTSQFLSTSVRPSVIN